MRKKILDFIKFKNFCLSKDIKKSNRHATDWENTFAKHLSDKRLASIPTKYTSQ